MQVAVMSMLINILNCNLILNVIKFNQKISDVFLVRVLHFTVDVVYVNCESTQKNLITYFSSYFTTPDHQFRFRF